MYNALVEPFAPWKFWIDLVSAACAFGAAAFWLKASLVKGPPEVKHPFHLPLEGPWKGDVPEAGAMRDFR